MNPHKLLGKTYVTFDGVVDTHPHSTGRIEVRATWSDPIDPLSETKPRTEDHAGHAFDLEIGYDDENPRPFPKILSKGDLAGGQRTEPPPRHELGDTKHHLITYQGIGTTRFREYFPTSITNDPKLITIEGPTTTFQVNVLSSRRPDPPKVLYVVP